jgi:hypothetical protein
MNKSVVLSMEKALLPLLFVSVLAGASMASIPPSDAVPVKRLHAGSDFGHLVGIGGSRGWVLDHKRDHPGYALSGLHEPLLLEPGLYRAVFILRRGHYPNKGFLNKTYGVVRLELWDLTDNELINQRELQRADFSSPIRFETRWMDFSMENRAGHRIEPRVFWLGLANTEIEAVQIERYPDVSTKAIEEKAYRLGELQEKTFLENGFVVSRNPDGSPDELGDAVTYTGLYAASLAWKYGATKSELTLQALENAIEQLHNAVKGTPDDPIITRFVDESGTPLFQSPSKDVYTAFFLAYSAAYPHIQNPALKKQMRMDVERLGNRFLQDRLTIRGGTGALISLTPYFTEDEVRHGISKLMTDKKMKRNIVKGLKQARRLAPFAELWPGIKLTIKAIEKNDAEKIYQMVVPTLNGVGDVMERSRDLLREQYRSDLFLIRFHHREYPGKQLETLLTNVLKRFPRGKSGKRFERLSDLPILSSNALLSLHIVRTAAAITQKPQFTEYYRNNLYTQDALLKCALDWYGMEEEVLRLTAGNAVADQERRGYLSALSLFNLIQLETNPEVKASYKKLFDVHWSHYRNEDNPMSMALQNVSSNGKPLGSAAILRALNLYPEDRNGFGDEHWKDDGEKIADELGGGSFEDHSREPLPISVRPKDCFLWQRNARRLSGDHARAYPATDFLFVYWFCRYYGIIPAAPQPPTVNQK